MKRSNHNRISLFIAFSCLILGVWLITDPVLARIDDNEFEQIVEKQITDDGTISDLNDQIDDKAATVRELEEKIDIYEQNIAEKQVERITLQTQISVIEDKIDQTKDSIQLSEIELEILQLEIETLQEQIKIAQDDIALGKDNLKQTLQRIYKYEQQTPVELIFGNATFSDFYANLEFTNRFQTNVQDDVNRVQTLKKHLQEKKGELKEKRSNLTAQKAELEIEQSNLKGEEQYKNQLLDETELSEEKFQLLLKQVREEQSQIEGQIATLEKSAQEKILRIRDEIQEKLDERGEDSLTEEEKEILDGNVSFIWPVYGTVTCGFHCAGYPFTASIGPHSGMDIGVPQGTPIKAASSGYVTIAKFDGTSAYGWILISHGNDFATVYGHVSGLNVAVDEYVRRGDIIGYTGGLPNTPGAGKYSTGAHLHFEVRVGGVPQDPAIYLP